MKPDLIRLEEDDGNRIDIRCVMKTDYLDPQHPYQIYKKICILKEQIRDSALVETIRDNLHTMQFFMENKFPNNNSDPVLQVLQEDEPTTPTDSSELARDEISAFQAATQGAITSGSASVTSFLDNEINELHALGDEITGDMN
jgi:hypothetical protein